MLFTAFIRPSTLIERFPQGFVAEMIRCIWVDLRHTGPIPVRTADHMVDFLQHGNLMFTPEGIFFLLLQNIIPADKIPESTSSLHSMRNPF